MIILSFHCGQCGAIWDVQEKDLDGNFPNCSRGCDEGTSFLNDYLIKEDWIPVSEGEIPTEKLLYCNKNWGEARVGYFLNGEWYPKAQQFPISKASDVTHYQPLPEPPKGEV